MNKNLTEMLFILDRSGSMHALTSDTVGGYNALLDKQRKEPGDALVSTVIFDDQVEWLHDRTMIAGIRPITERDCYARGTTALLDAIGSSIRRIDAAQRHTLKAARPDHTVVVIITDGMENASREYALRQVREMIREQKEKGWEFIFLGANIDAVSTAESFGIGADRAAQYCADSEGTQLNFDVVSDAVKCVRQNCAMSDDWKGRIDEDFQRRGR